MLTFPEEIILLALDDEDGGIKDIPRLSTETAVAAAALTELTFLRKVDAGPEKIYVADTSGVGDPVLDAVLGELSKETEEKPIAFWLNVITENLPDLIEEVVNSLVRKKVLRVENKKILWFFEKRRYPIVDDSEMTEVKTRLRHVIESGELPDERDMVLISLVRACHLFHEIFTEDELERYSSQIDKIAKFDFVGQVLSATIKDIEQTICLMNEAIYQYT